MRFYDKDANLIGDCGIAEARKNHYYPSVTTILDVINKHAINRWREDLLIEEAFNISPIFADHEREEAKKCVIDRVAAKADIAPRTGTLWHDDVANWLREGFTINEAPRETLENILTWLDHHKIEPVDIEHSFCNLMWAGTVDYIGTGAEGQRVFIDWKTQSTKRQNAKFYNTWAMQLAAYSGEQSTPPDLWSVVLSTTEPPFIAARKWSNADKWLGAFRCAFTLWCTLHNYNPMTGEKLLDEDNE